MNPSSLMGRLVPLFCLVFAAFGSQVRGKPFSPAFYPFANGVNFPTATEGVAFLKEHGYSGVGSIDPGKLAGFQAACEAEGLRIHSIYIGGRVNRDSYELEKRAAEAISLLKGSVALVELNVQRGREPDDAQAVALVRDVADKAKAAGLRVVIYPHADFHIERLEHAVKIARAAERDNVGIAFNLCHFLKVQPADDLSVLLKEAKPILWSVSICGADRQGRDWNTLIRPLDEGSFDQAAFLRLLRDIGYDGAVGLQCFNIRIPSGEHLARSMDAWRKNLAIINEP